MLNTRDRTLAFCLLFLITVSVDNSLALSCVEYSLEENFDRRDNVFIGTVIQKRKAPEEFSQTISLGVDYPERVVSALKVQFQVQDTWKGELDDRVTLYTLNPRESLWGYDFEVKGRYLVFGRIRKSKDEEEAENDKPQIWTNWCSQNVDLDRRFMDSDEVEGITVEDMLNDEEKLNKVIQNFVNRESLSFPQGIEDEKELNEQLDKLKLRPKHVDQHDEPTDIETDESSGRN